MPTIPAVPSPSVSLPPVPLTDPVGSLVNHVQSAVPGPTQVAALPGTVVSQLQGSTVAPLVTGITDPASSLVDTAVGTLPALPGLPSVPQLPSLPALTPPLPPLPPLPGVLDPPGTGLPIGAVPTVPVRARTGTEALVPNDPKFLHAGTLSPAPGRGTATSTRIPGFILADLVVLPPAALATTDMPQVPGGPPPGKQVPPVAPPQESGSTSESQGGSAANGAADLPEQRALAPPFHGSPVPDGGQAPAAEPAFDPGSTPD
ncbi:hypothetical protein [Arthrobacter gyeryongensis]|uniref:hypothetical protein n=1 Tax=Arthrobacter gyeryongensis TaxID=1650592 RepID=UPI0031EB5B28